MEGDNEDAKPSIRRSFRVISFCNRRDVSRGQDNFSLDSFPFRTRLVLINFSTPLWFVPLYANLGPRLSSILPNALSASQLFSLLAAFRSDPFWPADKCIRWTRKLVDIPWCVRTLTPPSGLPVVSEREPRGRGEKRTGSQAYVAERKSTCALYINRF